MTEQDRGGAGWGCARRSGVGRGRAGPGLGSGAARQDQGGAGGVEHGRAGPGQHQPGRSRARSGWGDSVRRTCGGGGTLVRERSRRKKGRARVLYPLMFVRPTHQPTNISGLAYVAAVAPYDRRPPDEHKLRTSV
jgi:hypothetical protein